MPQYGYALSGGNQRLGNLAEHHYLVTMIAWQLAEKAKKAGANIDMSRVLQFSLIHDIGELFGGDISTPYAISNPEARKHAKAFESENNKFISQFFGENPDEAQSMLDEILDAYTDEALVSKIADYVEVTMYKQFIGQFSQRDIDLIKPKLQEKIDKIKDPNTKNVISEFIENWSSDISKEYESFDLKIKDILGV